VNCISDGNVKCDYNFYKEYWLTLLEESVVRFFVARHFCVQEICVVRKKTAMCVKHGIWTVCNTVYRFIDLSTPVYFPLCSICNCWKVTTLVFQSSICILWLTWTAELRMLWMVCTVCLHELFGSWVAYHCMKDLQAVDITLQCCHNYDWRVITRSSADDAETAQHVSHRMHWLLLPVHFTILTGLPG